MTQKRVRRRPQSNQANPRSNRQSANPRHSPERSPRDRRNLAWTDLRHQEDETSSHNQLARLIEQDAPLKTNCMLVLMYGPFQAEMGSENSQGVASWIRDCVRKHGLPSLVRFDYRQRAQVFRRDQFQPWLEPFLNKTA